MQPFEQEQTITSDHPALPGHFPGNPVVPGVVILDQVLQALRRWQFDAIAPRVQDAKFVSPLLPDETMQIAFTLKGEQSVAFTCRVNERSIARGRIKLQRPSA